MTTFLAKISTIRLLAASLNRTSLTSKSILRHASQESKDPNIPEFDMKNPFEKESQQCILCRLNITPNYKNVKLLSQFQSPYTGRIYGRHITGLCAHKQKQVESEIVKAQSSSLMGYYNKDPVFMKDPKLFDPENPIRPHRF